MFNCWKCGAELTGIILPLSRREECQQCGADQHVCKLCKEYNPTTADSCDEELAEDVSNKETANFCDYFSPRTNVYQASDGAKKKQAAKELSKLFGDSGAEETELLGSAGAETFSPKPKNKSEKALSELEKLFGKGPSSQ